MKRLILILTAGSLISVLSVRSYGWGFSESGRKTVNMQTFLLSDFGDEWDKTHGIEWKASFSMFAPKMKVTDTNTGKEIEVIDTNLCAARIVEGKPKGLPKNVDEKQKYCLGVKAAFVRKGYNWIEVYPVVRDPKNPDAEPELGLKLPGIVHMLDFWVWGGNYKYTLDIYVRDYKGYLHAIRAGSIKFVGWRNLRIIVPKYIPQWEPHVPFIRNLRFVKFKLWADPNERVDKFYVYFDYMQVQTDIYVERYNGDDLAYVEW